MIVHWHHNACVPTNPGMDEPAEFGVYATRAGARYTDNVRFVTCERCVSELAAREGGPRCPRCNWVVSPDSCMGPGDESGLVHQACVGYAIRFMPAEVRDATPALYLSSAGRDHEPPRLTSVPADVRNYRSADWAVRTIPFWLDKMRRADKHLVADVVSYADAIRDLAD